MTERAILDGFAAPSDRREFVAYVGGSDATAHTHLGELAGYLTRLDAMLARVTDSLAARGTPVELWMVSDHGNVGAFREGERERTLTPFSLAGAIRRAGLVRVDTGAVDRPDEVAVVDFALGTMASVHLHDLTRRRALAAAALREPAVELVTWFEVAPDDRYVVALGPGGAEARVRWRGEGAAREYAVERVRGDALGVPDAVAAPAGTPRWVPDAAMRAATRDGRFPDAPIAWRAARRRSSRRHPTSS
jgi:hypothetical protein